MGAAALWFRRSYGGDAFRLVMAETMAPWLRAFSGSRWTVTGDREKFADAWRRWVQGQFPVEGMMHLPPPPCVPPFRPTAPVVAVVKAVLKVASKPPPPKKGLGVPYGSYSNIRVALKHFGGHLATEQYGVSNVNVCPWSRLEGAGQCPWRAGRNLKPSHLNPKDLLDHLARDHGSDPAQREQAEAMITGVMPRGMTGPFAAAKPGPSALAQPSGVQSLGAQEASSSTALSGARRSVAVSSRGGQGINPGAAHSGAARASLASSGVRLAAASSRGARRGSASGRAKGALHLLPGAGDVGPPPPSGQDQADDPHPAAMQ